MGFFSTHRDYCGANNVEIGSICVCNEGGLIVILWCDLVLLMCCGLRLGDSGRIVEYRYIGDMRPVWTVCG